MKNQFLIEFERGSPHPGATRSLLNFALVTGLGVAEAAAAATVGPAKASRFTTGDELWQNSLVAVPRGYSKDGVVPT
jgi:hypothetical protein